MYLLMFLYAQKMMVEGTAILRRSSFKFMSGVFIDVFPRELVDMLWR